MNALFIAAVVGAIIGNRASLSGRECGCQVEMGVAAAMVAAAVVYLANGPLIAIDYVISITRKKVLGLLCDLVAGLIICLCIKRNASGVVNAFLCAEMALSGVTSEILADEVIDAMRKVGRKIPFELKETGLGGIADTPTGRSIKKSLFPE